MAEYRSLTASEFACKLTKLEKPLVIMHARPDGDTVGSCAALINVFSQLGKEVKYACADEVPKRLRFILDGCSRATDEEIAERDAVTADVASEDQLGSLKGKLPGLKLMLDHHEIGTPFADNFIVHGASSAAEVVMEVCETLISLGKIKMTVELATALYAGISSDTGGFRYSSTTADTMRRAAELLAVGIDHSDINHRLFSTKSRQQIAAEGFAAENLITDEDGRVAYLAVTRDDLNRMGASMSDFDTAIDVIRSLEGVRVCFVVKDFGEGSYRISIRSTGVDVARVAAHFGGGGHIRAAGCTVCAASANEAAQAVLEIIKQMHF